MTGRRIYIASSWKNAPIVRDLAVLLREQGHEVFDFTDPECRPSGFDNFIFHASQWMGKPLDQILWTEFLECEATHRAYKSDRAGLDWADTVILLLPCGRSAHLEAGYAVGKGKDLFIWGELPPGQFEAMYLFSQGWYAVEDLKILLSKLNGSVMTE